MHSASRSYSRWLLPVLGLALVLPLSTIRAAEPAKAMGTITGKVTGEDGAAVADLPIQIRVPRPAGQGGGGAPKAKKTAEPTDPPPAPPGGGKRPAPVAETKTDKDGVYTVQVPPGEYVVTAGDRKSGVGGREKVTVEDGKTVTINVTVKKLPAGGGGGGRRGGN